MRAVNSITEAIIGDAITIHRDLGPGLLEATYEACLVALLTRRGLQDPSASSAPRRPSAIESV